MELEDALGIVRLMIASGISRDDALHNPVIPIGLRDQIAAVIEREDNIRLEPARFIVGRRERSPWLHAADRSSWHYWPKLRTYLLSVKGWPMASVRSLD